MGPGQRVPHFVPPQTEFLLIYVVKVLAFVSFDWKEITEVDGRNVTWQMRKCIVSPFIISLSFVCYSYINITRNVYKHALSQTPVFSRYVTKKPFIQ